MPSEKPRDFDDTWKKDELEKSLKRNHRKRDDDDQRRHRDRTNGSDAKSRDQDKYKSSRHHESEGDHQPSDYHETEEERRKRKERERRRRDEDGERRHKDEDRERRHKKDEDRHRRKDEDREHKRYDDDRERRHKGDDRERRHKDDNRERRHKDDNRERRHKDDDRERRHKDDDRERRHKDDDRERRHKDDDHERRHKDDDRERRHKDDDRERRHKDSDRERRHKDDDRDRRHKDGDRERRHKDDDRERRHKDRTKDDNRESKPSDNDDYERRKRHEEKKRREKEREREEENERQRQRDKQRQRRMEEEEQKQREREQRRQKEKEESERRKRQQQQKQEDVEEEAPADDDYADYEDDFEDYDDDFEDDEDEMVAEKPVVKVKDPHSKGYYKSLDWDVRTASRSEIDEVKLAMDQENDRLLRESRQQQPASDDSFEEYKPQRRRRHDDDDDDAGKSWGRPKTAQRTFINFTSAKQRHLTSQVASQARQRGVQLAQIIELDIAKFDIFDMPPVSEYELYMRTFGGSNTKQAIIQTNDDNMDRDIQTEEIEALEKWTQHPPEQLECVGGPDSEQTEPDVVKPIDQVKLGKFLQNAARTMICLLDEARLASGDGGGGDAGGRQHERRQRRSDICLSEAFSELDYSTLSFLSGRHITHCHISPSQSHMMLTAFSDSDRSSKGSALNCGMICVWNINDPQAPQKLLISESLPRCCCFSPIKSHFAFAGMFDGSLALWDLREAASLHTSTDGITFRYPTYSTAGVLQYENHQSAVIALQPVVAQAESSLGGLNNTTEARGLNFQLISLEENATLNLWVVSELGQSDVAGSESELGLRPGGRVKLIKSSVIQLLNPLRDARLRTTMRCFDLQLLPSNNSHFYVTTNVGCVLHGVRYGGKAPPSVYWTETESQAKITCIDFSPFSEPVFLTGTDDGTLRLHHTSYDHALVTWPHATGNGSAIECIRWCRSRPSLFFVLDSDARMHIWDLLMSDSEPMKREQIANERVTSFEVSNDHSATGHGTPGRKPQMVVCLESGACEVHTVSQEFSAMMPEETPQFTQFIQGLM